MSSPPLHQRPEDDWDGRHLRRRRLLAFAVLAVVAGGLAYVFWPVLKEDESATPVPVAAPISLRQVTAGPHSLEVMPGFDGNYYITAGVNGVPVLFQIMDYTDRTMLEPRDAERAHVKPDDVYENRDVLFSFGPVASATVATMKIGPETLDKVKVLVRANPYSVSTLGRDVLRRFKHWEKRTTASGAVAFVLDY